MGLASGAVIGFVTGVDNALYRCAAVGAGLFEFSVYRHAVEKRGDLVGKTVAAGIA